MISEIEESWNKFLKEEFTKAYFQDLKGFVEEDRKNYVIYPPENLIFSAFNFFKPDDLKVVILGQDPYHGEGQANGLCFSVNDGIRTPPSLVNIFKEIKSDLGKEIPASGNLDRWARQGVLLLNATLTVRANSPGSHQKRGWENFTNAIIEKISKEKEGLVFLLWGAFAHSKEPLINAEKHYILKAAHPSPFSAYRGFFGCRHFSKTNDYLISQGKQPINW